MDEFQNYLSGKDKWEAFRFLPYLLRQNRSFRLRFDASSFLRKRLYVSYIIKNGKERFFKSAECLGGLEWKPGDIGYRKIIRIRPSSASSIKQREEDVRY